jgi:hypothetical protein
VCPNALAAAHCRPANPSLEDDSWAGDLDDVFGELLDGRGFVWEYLVATRGLIPERWILERWILERVWLVLLVVSLPLGVVLVEARRRTLFLTARQGPQPVKIRAMEARLPFLRPMRRGAAAVHFL